MSGLVYVYSLIIWSICEGISTGIASGQSVSCEAVCWMDVAGVVCSISGSVILGVGDAVPCVKKLFDTWSTVGEEMSSISGSKSGASIWLYLLNSCADHDVEFASVVLPVYCIYCSCVSTGMRNMFAGG